MMYDNFHWRTLAHISFSETFSLRSDEVFLTEFNSIILIFCYCAITLNLFTYCSYK